MNTSASDIRNRIAALEGAIIDQNLRFTHAADQLDNIVSASLEFATGNWDRDTAIQNVNRAYHAAIDELRHAPKSQKHLIVTAMVLSHDIMA